MHSRFLLLLPKAHRYMCCRFLLLMPKAHRYMRCRCLLIKLDFCFQQSYAEHGSQFNWISAGNYGGNWKKTEFHVSIATAYGTYSFFLT